LTLKEDDGFGESIFVVVSSRARVIVMLDREGITMGKKRRSNERKKQKETRK
jgi:hypothetical protein